MNADDNLPITSSIPAFGRVVLNLSASQSYEAAKRGDFQTIGKGRRKRVPLRPALRPYLGDVTEKELAAVIARISDADALD